MKIYILSMLTVVLLLTGASVQADKQPSGSPAALENLSEIHVYFDVNIGDPEKLIIRLELIDMTYRQIVAAGVEPHFVIGFRGKASRYLTTGDNYTLKEEIGMKRQIREKVLAFNSQAIPLEQCRIAASLLDINPADFPAEITVVPNGYVSIAGYQAKGYAFVPMD